MKPLSRTTLIMFEALCLGPGTATQLARISGCDLCHVQARMHALTSAGYLVRTDRSPEPAFALTPKGFLRLEAGR